MEVCHRAALTAADGQKTQIYTEIYPPNKHFTAAGTMSTDLNCHGSPVSAGEAGAGAGYARLNMSRTDCSFTQRDDRDGSFNVSRSHAHIRVHKLTRKQSKPRRLTHKHSRLSMIDGERHKGQQSAGLHLDRTRLLLHHLDSGDAADPNRSFPMYYTAQVSSCFKEPEL